MTLFLDPRVFYPYGTARALRGRADPIDYPFAVISGTPQKPRVCLYLGTSAGAAAKVRTLAGAGHGRLSIRHRAHVHLRTAVLTLSEADAHFLTVAEATAMAPADSPAPSFLVECLFGYGWDDAGWNVDNGPLRYPTKAAAELAIDEFIRDTQDAYAAGDLDTVYSRDDYRAAPDTYPNDVQTVAA